jgi:hypothetical protein
MSFRDDLLLDIISDLLFGLILLSGVYTVLTNWKRQALFIAVAIAAAGLRVASFFIAMDWIKLTNYFVAILFLAFLMRMVLQHIFKEGPVNFYRIQGSVVVFIIIGIVWAFLYTSLELVWPDAFTSTIPGHSVSNSFPEFLYFSFVTLTTLGFGDMVPIYPVAKSMVMFEGMIGLLYPVIMIARLVSLEVENNAHHRNKK